jgi:hypothetical protein
VQSAKPSDYRPDVVPDQALTPPTAEQLESWAGRGRVVRATAVDVSTWRITAPTMYRLALDYDDGPTNLTSEYGAVPETGEVRR